jgi:DNA-binding response OmpR family regulator
MIRSAVGATPSGNANLRIGEFYQCLSVFIRGSKPLMAGRRPRTLFFIYISDERCTLEEMSSVRILIVEDDRSMAELLQKGLEEEAHVVSLAHDGAEGLELSESYQFDVVVLDWMLPLIDGLEVARRLRKSGRSIPILMLTARDAVPDIVKGLDAGADDYLTKPFSFAEFLARLRALARRPAAARSNRLETADLSLDLGTRRVFRGRQEIHLTQTEYRLLEFLMRRSGGAASRRAIIEAVWGLDADVEENTLDAFVRLLRSKVDHRQKRRLIHTVRGFGYCVRPEAGE